MNLARKSGQLQSRYKASNGFLGIAFKRRLSPAFGYHTASRRGSDDIFVPGSKCHLSLSRGIKIKQNANEFYKAGMEGSVNVSYPRVILLDSPKFPQPKFLGERNQNILCTTPFYPNVFWEKIVIYIVTIFSRLLKNSRRSS